MELSTPSLGRLVRDPALLDEGVMLVDSGDACWPIVYANTAAAKLAGGTCCAALLRCQCCCWPDAQAQTHSAGCMWGFVSVAIHTS